MIEVIYPTFSWFKNCSQNLIEHLQKFTTDVSFSSYRRQISYTFSDGIERELRKKVIITNKLNGKVFIFDPFDKNDFEDLIDILNSNPEVVHVVKCQFNPDTPLRNDFKKAIYVPKDINLYGKVVSNIKLKRISERLDKRLFFSGKKWKRRKKILRKMNTVYYGERLSPEDFILQLSQLKIALSLPGNGNFCHREFECFGVGTPVLMPELLNQTYDPLLPNIHYISVERTDDTQELAKRLDARYNEVIEDDDFLQFISDNCFHWYNKNVKKPNTFSIINEGISKIL